MKALRFESVGSLEALRLDHTPVPVPAPGSVLIRVHGAGVNPSDIKNVLGRFPYTTVPRTPGRDFAGVVVEGPTELLGMPVWGSGCELGFTRDGTHAEFVTVAERAVAPKPSNLSFAEAAACGVPYLTALEALNRCGAGPGSTVALIGMGAVGAAAHAIAACRGASVVAGVRRGVQAANLRNRGVEAFAFEDCDQFATQVRRHFADGAEVVFDTTGAWLHAAVAALTTAGHTAVISAPADGHVRLPIQDFYRCGGTLVGVNSLLHGTVASTAALNTLRELFEAGSLTAPERIETRPLDSAAQVFRDIAHGAAQHKFVLTPQID
jgi:NADPH2:quinone reductase